jgi:hypothetical protein
MSTPKAREIAHSFALWAEYVDPGATMIEADFDAMSEDDRLSIIAACFGEDAEAPATAPGPWSVAGAVERVVVNGSGEALATVHGTEADARLMAAAPDLLAALSTLVRGPGLCGPELWRADCLRRAIAAAREVIDGVEGNQ